MKKSMKAVIGVAAVGVVAIIAAVVLKLNMSSTALDPTHGKTDYVTNNELVQNKLKALQSYEETGEDLPTRGTKENPFIVVEIVPHKSQGYAGYYFPGDEPYNMQELTKNLWDMKTYVETIEGIYDGEFIEKYKFPEELEEGASINDRISAGLDSFAAGIMADRDYKIEANPVWTNTWLNGIEGYYEWVGEGNGYFDLQKDWQGNPVMWGDTPAISQVVGGSYRWVTAKNTENIPTDVNAQQIWTTRMGQGYHCYDASYEHKDVLVKGVFGKTSDQIVKQVFVLSSDEFLNEKNLDLIKAADMIWLHAGDPSGKVAELWGKYNKDGAEFKDKNGKVIDKGSAASMSFDANDITWKTAEAIVRKMGGERRPALVMDNNVLGAPSTTNTLKLAMMVRLYDPRMTVELFLNQDVQNADGETVKKIRGKMVKDKDGNDWETGVLTVTNDGSKREVTNWNRYNDFYPDGFANEWRENVLLEAGMRTNNFSIGDKMSMVADNIFCYFGGTDFLQKALDEGFMKEHDYNGEAFDYHEEYGDDGRPSSMSSEQLIEYLLQQVPTKRKLKILEVQSCNQFIYSNDPANDSWKPFYISLLPWFEGKLKGDDLIVDRMTTAQFNSSIIDLNSEYDAIIFGSEQNASNGKNGYNDTGLGHLAYTSIGDLVSTDLQKYYGENTDKARVYVDDSMRYSGTDISEKKLNELLNYMDGGKPIILTTEFVNQNYDHDLVVGSNGSYANAEFVDVSSNTYKLLQFYDTQDMSNQTMFVKGHYASNKLKRVLAYENCKLEFVSYKTEEGSNSGYPTEYTYQTDAEGCIVKNSVTYSSSNFVYRFKIAGKSNRKYGINLFIDIDSDGVYKGSLKELAEGHAVLRSSEMVSGFTIKAVGSSEPADPNNLNANVTYELTKKLDSAYQGILPWKLEAHRITLNGQTDMNCRSNQINYSAVKGESKKIRVLLMSLTKDMSNLEDYFSESRLPEYYWTWKDKRIGNLAGNGTDAKKFAKYLNCVPEFDVELIWMDNSKWKELFDGDVEKWKQYLDSGDPKNDLTPDELRDNEAIDMIVLGFMDDCTYTDNETFHEGFQYFVEQGKGVILSHDMVRDTSESEYLLTRFDEDLRTMMGQRRYSAKNVTWDANGNAQTQSNGRTVNLVHKNENNAGSPTVKPVLDLSVPTVRENGAAGRLPGFYDNSSRLLMSFGDASKCDRVVTQKLTNWPMSAYNVNKINDGQITGYPYDIPEYIGVAETHAQNFQLDMETDTENGDVVVWYGLTDSESSHKDDTSSKKNGGVYSSIEGDGRNNFYIYNKGNITYTGLGHRPNMTDDEVKLFVNTMIAAYRASKPIPKLVITNEDAITEEDDVTIYVNVDEGNEDMAAGLNPNKDLDVTFTIEDPNVVDIGNTFALTYEYKVKDANGNITGDIDNAYKLGEAVIAIATTVISDSGTNGPVAAKDASGNTIVYKDGQYSFKVPYALVKQDGMVEYDLILYSTYINEKGKEITRSKTTHLRVMQTPLFTLN